MRRALLVLSIVACHPAPPARLGPRSAVTDWSQVERFHCGTSCSSDADCTGGQVCDTSAGCGCCVTRPPVVDTKLVLRRSVFTACDPATKACVPPPGCELAADGKSCTVHFDGSIWVWASTFRSQSIDDTRRQLCIKIDPPSQSCFWALEVPGGSYAIDSPFPTHYTGSYECGGETCNDRPALRVAPKGDVTATLVVDGCHGR